jgi:hypothetical protein
MKYLCLAYRDEAVWDAMPRADYERIVGEILDYREELRRGGNFIYADAVQPARTAATIRVRDAGTTVTDGPYAETKEQLGGFYLIEATDLDQAIQLVSAIPSAPLATIEVRSLKELDVLYPRSKSRAFRAG